MSRPLLHRAAAVTGAGTLSLLALAAPASAATGDGVDVVNTETVQVYTDATGEVQSKRLYEQLHLTGTGSASVENPAVLEGLRNLEGFGGFATEDGDQVVEVEVDGTEDVRTVSDYDEDLPLEIEVEYALDGEPVEPGDLVGATGELEVLYTVTNVTGRIQTVSFDDGKGGTTTEDVEVAVPMVGSLTTVLPASFRDVASGQANMAGDGRGNTKLSFTMTLVPPIGTDTVAFGYTAQIQDAVLPRASVTALPVNPLEVPTFKSAGDSYAAGAATGSELADGASQIDSNLLLLRDGAGDLLAGLIKLRDGSAQLQAGLQDEAAPGSQELADGAGRLADGLQGEAAPGSEKLADGAGQLSDGLQGEAAPGSQRLAAGAGDLEDGLDRIDDGAGRLADGSGRLAAGTGDAVAGSRKLTDGLAQISGGLDQLADVKGLPAAQQGVQQLRAGVNVILAGLGDTGDAESLIGGLTRLQGGLGELETGAGTLVGGLEQVAGGLPTAKGGVDQVKQGLDDATGQGGSLDTLIGGLQSLLQIPACRDDQQCAGTVNQLVDGAQSSKANLTQAAGALGQVSSGLGTAVTAMTGQILPGARKVEAGISQSEDGATKLQAGAVAVKDGVSEVGAGLDQVSAGLTSAVAGVFDLADGASSAVGGSVELGDGLSRLDAGAQELAGGAGELAAGTGDAAAGSARLSAGAQQLAEGLIAAAVGSGELAAGATKLSEGLQDAADGSGELADGAGRLADGLQDAADGSGRLTDGLEEAAGGAPQLVDGAQRLSDEGTSKLVEAGEDVAQDYGVLYAQLEAGAERAEEESMVVGAPEDAIGLAAYSFEITGENGEGSRNLARGMAAVGLLGAAGGTFLLRRRLA